jgi:hypothetical protein
MFNSSNVAGNIKIIFELSYFLICKFSLHFLHAHANIHYMQQRIFAHDLLEREMIIAGSFEFCLRLHKHAMLINIIHRASHPTFFVCCQCKIEALVARRIAGLLHNCFYPDVIIIVGIGMAHYQINIIARYSVCNIECYLRPEAALPLLLRDWDVFFKNIDRIIAGCDKQAAGKAQKRNFFQ